MLQQCLPLLISPEIRKPQVPDLPERLRRVAARKHKM